MKVAKKKLAKVTNKNVIQSYVLTTAKYDFNVYEKRILYRLIEVAQCLLEKKHLDWNFTIQTSLFDGCKEVTAPISVFLRDKNDDNYKHVKSALTSLNEKRVEYETNEFWKIIRIIETPKFFQEGWVKFRVHEEVFEAIMNFAKGFRKYELQTAMSFSSTYSMRFYELLSGQKSPITYKVDYLKAMFHLENKYKDVKDFIRWVIAPAKAELDAHSAHSFEYTIERHGRTPYAITFTPVKILKNENSELQEKELLKQTSIHWDLTPLTIAYLKEHYLFSDVEIKNNRTVFAEAEKKIDLIYELSLLKRKAAEAKNPKGYVIKALRGKLNDLAKQL